MLLYLALFAFVSLFAYLELICKPNRIFRLAFVLFIFVCFILASFRWEVGTDWESYNRYFNEIKVPFGDMFSIHDTFEFGFILLNNFAKSISNEYTFCLLLQAVIIYVFLGWGIYKGSYYPLLSVFIYFSMALGGIFFVRQTMALAILFYSISFIEQQKLKKFLLFVLLASLLHRTAVFFVFAYPIFTLRYSWKKIFVLFFVSVVVGSIVGILLLQFISSLNLGVLSLKLASYLNTGNDVSYTTYSTTATIIRGSINRFFLIFLYILLLRNERLHNSRLNGIINLQLFGICLYFMFTPISLEFARIGSFFDMAQVLAIPYLFKVRPKIKEKTLLFTIIFLYSAFRFYVAVNQHRNLYIPYNFVDLI